VDQPRFELTETVRWEGHNFWGQPRTLVVEPTTNPDWVWKVGDEDIPIRPDIMHSRKRRVALVANGHALHGFEHIGGMRAFGLRGVRIWVVGGKRWPPYDGSMWGLWNALMPHVRQRGTLKPHHPYIKCYQETAYVQGAHERFVDYRHSNNDRLHMRGYIDFDGLGEYEFAHTLDTYDYDRECNFRELMRAHTLGWPPYLQAAGYVASKLGWPHHRNHVMWAGSRHPYDILDEVARHRLLDIVSILNFAAPAECYLAGRVFSHKGNHAADLALLQILTRFPAHKVVALPLTRKVA